MNRHIFITLLVVWGALCIGANAQTPYDAFAPETSRPMLGLDAINMMENPSQCNVINDSIWSTKSSVDNVSKWLSVDPLSDKYPSISPYAYCNWNPVKYVDPDGCDTFNICTQNELITCIPNHGNDIVRFVDSNGNVKKGADGNFLEVSFKENSISLMDGISGFIVQGDEAGTELFEFLATSGAQKEWSHLKTGTDESGTNYIGTNWKNGTTTMAKRIKTKYLTPGSDILREQIHNHPIGGILTPSGTVPKLINGVWKDAGTWGDLGVKNATISTWGNSVIFKIYGLDVNTEEYIYVTY